MPRTACLVIKVSYVSGRSNTTLEKQVLEAATKQSRQANKAVGSACFVLGPLALFCALLLANATPCGFFTN
jgi:hypothetical protein